MRYDRGRGSLDRHATHIVSTFDVTQPPEETGSNLPPRTSAAQARLGAARDYREPPEGPFRTAGRRWRW